MFSKVRVYSRALSGKITILREHVRQKQIRINYFPFNIEYYSLITWKPCTGTFSLSVISVFKNMGSGFQTSIPKPEFQNILKYNSAEPEFSFS
jgi:hypothetical protein